MLCESYGFSMQIKLYQTNKEMRPSVENISLITYLIFQQKMLCKSCTLVFCSDFFPWHVWRKKVDLWFWVFPQVAEVGKTEKNIILRLRQRRSLKKCFSQFFLLRNLGKNSKSEVNFFSEETCQGKKLEQNAFFSFYSIFVTLHIPAIMFLEKIG